MPEVALARSLELLNVHHHHYMQAYQYAAMTAQPTPEDSRAWSQILISLLTDIPGLSRQKGPDLADGSDVKSANAWFSIDVVRFNSVIKAGTRSNLAGSMSYLDQVPYLFFVLWDGIPETCTERARIWVVRPQQDILFRQVTQQWYNLLAQNEIRSNNFQLHPPVNRDDNIFTNRCGDLTYPLLLDARWNGYAYDAFYYDPSVLTHGACCQPHKKRNE